MFAHRHMDYFQMPAADPGRRSVSSEVMLSFIALQADKQRALNLKSALLCTFGESIPRLGREVIV